MRGVTINQAAFGCAILLHALVLSLGVRSRPAPEPAEPIAIRFASVEERVAPRLAPLKQTLAGEVKPPLVNENNSQPQQGVAPALPVREPVRRQETPPVFAPVPAAVPQARVEPAAAVAAAPKTPPPVAAPSRLGDLPQAAQAQSGSRQPRQEGEGRPREAGVAAAAQPSPRLAEYLAVVRGTVENNREYPAMARQLGLTGTVTVRVSIRGDGSIGEVTVAASAGHKSLDRAAVSAVRRAAPFKTPGGFGLGQVTVEIPIVYRLT